MRISHFLPTTMNVPPTQERVSGATPVIRLWAEKARTSSKVLKLATRFLEIIWRDLVRVKNANSPDMDSPKVRINRKR